ncbi:MAG: MFS transporter [Chloroherpetonaceae bacterium]|nr:MFS transporter [Chloroherpetonaceae bacterium]
MKDSLPEQDSGSIKITPSQKAPRSEWLLLLTLSAIQFTNVLDFVIMMPLGPQLMRVFDISASGFGLIVASYTFSAGISGFIASFFIDRFERRKALLFLYAGFSIGTLLCGLAPTAYLLAMARVVAGFFGGVMGAQALSIIADCIPENRRGAAMGTLMSSFAVASIAGVPAGLYLANHFGWQMVFLTLTLLSVIVWGLAYRSLPKVDRHLASLPKEFNLRHQIQGVREMIQVKTHQQALVMMIMLMIAGFTVIPYISPYFVANVGLTEADLPLIYFFGGAATIFSSRIVGVLADKFGKRKVFTVMAILSIGPLIGITSVPPIPLAAALIVTTLFMVTMNGRFVPATAMVTTVIEPKYRGSFMSFNSSAQQLAAGIGSFGAGLIIGKNSAGQVTLYWLVGLIAVSATLACIYLAHQLPTPESGVLLSSNETSFENVEDSPMVKEP